MKIKLKREIGQELIDAVHHIINLDKKVVNGLPGILKQIATKIRGGIKK